MKRFTTFDFGRLRASFAFLMLAAVTLPLLLLSSPASAAYIALNAGFAGLSDEWETYNYSGSLFDLENSTSEAYEITAGWDLSHRFSIEMSWSKLGDYDYREIGGSDRDSIELLSFRVNGLYYLFSTNGFEGLRSRTGFSGFLKFGGGRLLTESIFSSFGDELGDDYISLGLGAEIGLNRNTYFRFQVQAFGSDLVFGSAAIMWRFGRRPGTSY